MIRAGLWLLAMSVPAVAAAKPREDADHLAMTLRAHHHEGSIESGAIKRGEGRATGGIGNFHPLGLVCFSSGLMQQKFLERPRPQGTPRFLST